ncbi:unnamed protein product, partial [Mesorhabditis spiculigera]
MDTTAPEINPERLQFVDTERNPPADDPKSTARYLAQKWVNNPKACCNLSGLELDVNQMLEEARLDG